MFLFQRRQAGTSVRKRGLGCSTRSSSASAWASSSAAVMMVRSEDAGTWPANSIWSKFLFLFPGIWFQIPFSPYIQIPKFPGKISAFFCKIHKLPVILCHFPQFRQNSVKFAAKNARFADKSANFCKNPKISTKNCKITQKLALERCKGATIL